MEMLLMGACLSLLGLAVSCMAFGAALPRDEQPSAVRAAIQPEVAKAAAPARFFGDPAQVPILTPEHMPIAALLLQIENHVRLEQAAAESFLAAPNSALLHSRTMSPLVN